MKTLHELIEYYEAVFMYGGIQQSIEELESLIKEIGNKKFSSMAEIGVADGGTLWLYANLFAKQGCKFTVTDMDIRPLTFRVMAELKKEMGIRFKIIECMGDEFRLEDEVDFLHIDGDHSHNAVRNDFYRNNNKVKEGGYIVIHDTMLMEGPIRMRLELEGMGLNMKTFIGKTVLCDCFAPNRGNPQGREFGTTVVIK